MYTLYYTEDENMSLKWREIVKLGPGLCPGQLIKQVISVYMISWSLFLQSYILFWFISLINISHVFNFCLTTDKEYCSSVVWYVNKPQAGDSWWLLRLHKHGPHPPLQRIYPHLLCSNGCLYHHTHQSSPWQSYHHQTPAFSSTHPVPFIKNIQM